MRKTIGSQTFEAFFFPLRQDRQASTLPGTARVPDCWTLLNLPDALSLFNHDSTRVCIRIGFTVHRAFMKISDTLVYRTWEDLG